MAWIESPTRTTPHHSHPRPTSAMDTSPVPQIHVRVSETLQYSASETLCQSIVRGLELRHFVPGQRLVEADLCAHFGVARTTVREAFQRLAANGIVEINRHRGASIRMLSFQESMDVLDVAEAVIALLVRTAARHIQRQGAAEVLREALAALQKAAKTQDWTAAGAARRGFYHALHDISGNRELRRLFNQIHLNVFQAQFPPGALDALRLVDYQKIGKAVLAGNEAAADAAWREHVARVKEETVRNFGAGSASRHP